MDTAQLLRDVEALEARLAGGHSPDELVDEASGRRLLHEAARGGNAAAVELLAARGADVNARTADGDTPLHLCVEADCRDGVRELLRRSANPNVANNAQDTPLHLCAAAEDGAEMLRLLLHAGADCRLQDAYQDTILHRACFEENLQAVAVLLEAAPQVVNSRNAAGFTGLHIAASCENSELLGLLLRKGADLQVADNHGCTVVDLLLANEDTSGIDSLGRFLFRRLRDHTEGDDSVKVVSSDAGVKFLGQLMTIDGVSGVASTCEEPERQARVASLRGVIAARKIDAEPFLQQLIQAFNDGLQDELEECGLLERCSLKIAQLVLLPQDEDLLQKLVSHRRLWAAVSFHIERNIDQLYAKTLKKKKAGVRELLRKNCTQDGENKICMRHLSSFIARLTSYWQFKDREIYLVGEDSGWTAKHKRPLQDPLQSLVVWSIFSSRLKLVPILLRQEQFDMVPLALLATAVLRSLGRRRDIEDVFADKASKIADVCEGMALQVIKAVKDVDNSPNNSLTIDYVSLPLPSFANYNILDLAARGNARELIKLDVMELAIEKSWYADFSNFRSPIVRELVIISGFVPPLMLLLPTLLSRFRGSGSTDFLESVLDKSDAPSKNEAESTEQQHQLQQQRSLDRRQKEFSHRINEYVSAMLLFYSTPCVKFRLHSCFYFLFVGLLSYTILHDFHGKVSFTEIFCYFTLLGVFCEEVREMISCARHDTLGTYLSDGWNIIDLVAISCGFCAFIFRRLDPTEVTAIVTPEGVHYESWRDFSYILIVTTTLIFWIRVLFISVVLESVGVKLKMLSLMIKKDFIPFLYILGVIMFGFGIAFHALLWPNAKYVVGGKYIDIPPAEIMLEMFKRTFYTIVGEYGLDDMDKECMLSNSTEVEAEGKCVGFPGSVLVPYVLMVVYIVVVQVLLLNVIVAMFSKTIDMVDSESKSMWLFERYDLTQEFNRRSPLPSPLNVALELRNLVMWLSYRLLVCRRPRRSVMQILAQNLSNFVYCFFLFYQSVAMRRMRRRLDGMDVDEDELSDEGATLLRQLRRQQDQLDRLTAASEQ